MRNGLHVIAAAAFAALGITSAANASVIVSDSLTSNDGESGNLNGSYADTYPGSGGAKWTSVAYTRASGGTTINDGSGPPNGASFPITGVVTSGNIYTLNCTFSIANPTGGGSGSSGDWVCIQFNHADSSQLTQGASSGHSEYEPWMFVRTNNGGGDIGDGGYGGGAVGATTFTSSQEDQALYTLSIVLNTTGTYWAATYYENGIQVGTFNYSATYPNPSSGNSTDIEAISVGSYDTAVAVATNFSLTETPEPASLSLLGLGSIGLLVRRQRRPIT